MDTVQHRSFLHARMPSTLVGLKHRAARFVAKEGPLRRDYSDARSFAKEASLLFCYIFAGWNDATAGALLPAIQQRYGLSFSIVSLLFVANLVGWITAALVTPELLKHLTFGRAVTVITALAIVPSVVIAAGSPFPVMACAYALFGLSIGAMDGVVNAWISARPQARIRLGLLHFIYGVGALCAPLAGTPFVTSGKDFHLFYLGSLALCVCNTIFVTASFRMQREGYPGEELEPEVHRQFLHPDNGSGSVALSSTPTANDIQLRTMASNTGENSIEDRNATSPVAARQSTSSSSMWKTILSQRDTHVFAVFCLFYVGTEVSIGGWTSTFIINVRGDIENSGHIVSGFWAGLAAGRVLLLPVTHFLGSQVAVLVYLGLSIALQFVVWFAPSIVANGVAVAIMGLLLGPLFPIMIELISKRIIPRSGHTTAIAYIVAFGSAGSALFPLIVGLIIQSYGAQQLAPTLLAFLCAQTGIFLLLGRPKNNVGEAERAQD